MKILIVDDDKPMVATIKEELDKHFITEVAYTGEEGEYLAELNSYNLIILDVVLPDANGIEICKKLRNAQLKTPIMMLSGSFAVPEKVKALDSGADDYMTKPFNFAELIARIRALLRRQFEGMLSNILSVGDLQLDLNKKIAKREDIQIPLRRKELYLLEYLMRNVGKVITRQMIIDHIWESEYESYTNVVDVHINYLREKVDKRFNKKLIKTVHGLGYKIEE